VFLLCTAGFLVPVYRRRRRRNQTRILVALVAGAVCGALWMLLVDTVANARTDTIYASVVLLVGVVTAVLAALFLSAPESPTEVAGISMIVVGFHMLALPIAALISFLIAGAAWMPDASAERRTVALSVAGLLVGALLVFLGDRVLLVRRMRVRKPIAQRNAP
jgi:F0F1-type ATP synthase assembly protein I